MSDLAARIRSAGPELARESLDAMYRDPFWLDRFGERGRAFALEDGLHHVAYLANAIWSGRTDSLESYARWLQSVLTARGMCTLHIEENFASLARAIRARNLDPEGVAARYLAAAREALRYRGRGKRLQEATLDFGRRAADGMPPERLREATALASFLADATALSETASLAGHVAWLRAYHSRTGVGREILPRMVDRLAAGVHALGGLPEEERAFAVTALSFSPKESG